MKVRCFIPGDEVHQAAIYNEAARQLPHFTPARPEDIGRRFRSKDYDLSCRFLAEIDGQPVGYIAYQRNGRLSYPWVKPGYESVQPLLVQQALTSARERGLTKLFAAYRATWSQQHTFFEGIGFTKVREMVNFVLEFAEMPTLLNRSTLPISPLLPQDLPALEQLYPGLLRLSGEALEKFLFRNSMFSPSGLFAMRSRSDGTPLAVGLIIEDGSYADALAVDPYQPCFWLGAFGNEGLSVKRINGLFSYLIPPHRDAMPWLLDLLGYAMRWIEESSVSRLAAQVPSDVPHLLAGYEKYFRRLGSFPVYEMFLTPPGTP